MGIDEFLGKMDSPLTVGGLVLMKNKYGGAIFTKLTVYPESIFQSANDDPDSIAVLTKTEGAILGYLMMFPRYHTYDDIYNKLGFKTNPESSNVRTHANSMRSKINQGLNIFYNSKDMDVFEYIEHIGLAYTGLD